MLDAAWFVITRDDDEAYFGAVTVNNGIEFGMLFLRLLMVQPVFTECTVTGDTGAYLDLVNVPDFTW